ncbi:MAG: 23S rRNA (guanosine(2251)-2'-O)-methyltransferase RlmB [candidate division Zixibacteria bacterium]|nr:23S rRNA (guanosine(2251)-2'-O)-methyltransferase RlmB [candidate division Zixibacteria bacterium]
MGQRPRSKSDRKHKHSDYSAVPRVGSEDDLFDIISLASGPPLILVLDEVQDPHNLGACLRTADAAGVHAVVTSKDRAVGLTEVVIRTACGGAEHVPFFQVTNLARTLGQLKEVGLWLMGTSDRAEQSLFEADLSGPLAIVMGAEGKGLRRLTEKHCDYLVRIPMSGMVECLNVSVAAGICLFEAVRQRTMPARKK